MVPTRYLLMQRYPRKQHECSLASHFHTQFYRTSFELHSILGLLDLRNFLELRRRTSRGLRESGTQFAAVSVMKQRESRKR